MNCVVWCHAHLLHIAISIIDDHYSFSLKSVREKLLQTPHKQQQIWCDDATKNKEKMLFLFLSQSMERRETPASPQKTSSIHCFSVEMRLHTVTQWILNGVRRLWGFAGSGVEITGWEWAWVKHQICSISEAKSNRVSRYTLLNFCHTLHRFESCSPALPPFLLLPF